MAPKAKPAPEPSISYGNFFNSRMGLGVYLDHPETFPPSVVISYDDDFVIIHDKFPKASVHTLVLPRSSEVYMKHPIDALEDPVLLEKVKVQVQKVKTLVAAELQRRFGKFSAIEAPRQAVLNGEVDDGAQSEAGGEAKGQTSEIPPGRDWLDEVKCGIHAVPSMSHLHIHVLSREMHSPALKHKKHYNSFNTPFLVDVDDFPLPADDPRRNTREAGYLHFDLKCWRCGRNFKNQFKQLKEHLDVEFDHWKRL